MTNLLFPSLTGFYCHKSFAGGAFFEYQGKPYCECHYYQMTGSLCAGCGKPVGTRSITALEKKWHPEHFVFVRYLSKFSFPDPPFQNTGVHSAITPLVGEASRNKVAKLTATHATSNSLVKPPLLIETTAKKGGESNNNNKKSEAKAKPNQLALTT